jgi:hypothetical protein
MPTLLGLRLAAPITRGISVVKARQLNQPPTWTPSRNHSSSARWSGLPSKMARNAAAKPPAAPEVLRDTTQRLPRRRQRLLDPSGAPFRSLSMHWAHRQPLLCPLSTRRAITWIMGNQGTLMDQHFLNHWRAKESNAQEAPRRLSVCSGNASRCKGWVGPLPWFENHFNQTNHAHDGIWRICTGIVTGWHHSRGADS